MRTAPKRRNRSITKSCGDAKLELFPGARPPDTTFTSWYDLTLALVYVFMITTRGCDWDMLMEIIMPYLPLLRKTPPGCGPSKRSRCRSRILISSPAEKILLWSESKTHFLPKMGRKNGSWWEYFTSPKLCWQHMFTLWGMDLTAKKLFSPWANLAPQCTLASCCHTKSWRTCSHQLVGHQCLHQDSRLGRRIAWAMLRRKDWETQNLRTYWRWFHGGFLLDESMRYAKYGGLSQGLCGNLDVFESICFRRFSGKCFPNWESLPTYFELEPAATSTIRSWHAQLKVQTDDAPSEESAKQWICFFNWTDSQCSGDFRVAWHNQHFDVRTTGCHNTRKCLVLRLHLDRKVKPLGKRVHCLVLSLQPL